MPVCASLMPIHAPSGEDCQYSVRLRQRRIMHKHCAYPGGQVEKEGEELCSLYVFSERKGDGEAEEGLLLTKPFITTIYSII